LNKFLKSIISVAAIASATFAGNVLFVVDNASGTNGDAQIQSRLQSLGHSVVVKDDEAVALSDANGNDLVLVSGSVRSGAIGDMFKNTTIPFMTSESYLYDNMGMTGTEV